MAQGIIVHVWMCSGFVKTIFRYADEGKGSRDGFDDRYLGATEIGDEDIWETTAKPARHNAFPIVAIQLPNLVPLPTRSFIFQLRIFFSPGIALILICFI